MENTIKASMLIGENTYALKAFEKLTPDIQKKIFDAAANVFAQEGYHYASISNICRKANISNGALYKYFKNKESLFLAVLNYSANLVETELYQEYILDATSIFDAVRDLLNGLVQFAQDNLDYTSIYCDLGSSSLNRFAATTSEKFRKASSLYILKMVKESQKKNEVGSRIQSEVAAYLIDNYITLFSYALVSEYQNHRLNSFFTTDGNELATDQQIELIITSLRQVLQK